MLTRAKPVLPPEQEELVTRTIGCAVRVHKELGPGYAELIYQDAMRIELELESVPFQYEVPVIIHHRGRPLRSQRLDLVIDQQIVVELKTVTRLEPVHQTQLLSYLKATGLRVGLLMNFHDQVLKAGLRRFVL